MFPRDFDKAFRLSLVGFFGFKSDGPFESEWVCSASAQDCRSDGSVSFASGKGFEDAGVIGESSAEDVISCQKSSLSMHEAFLRLAALCRR